MLSDMLGTSKPNDINYNFNYDPLQGSYNPNSELTGSLNNLNQAGANYTNMSQNFMDPNSAWFQSQMQQMNRGVQDASAQGANQMNMSAAQRGFGQGGWASMFNQMNADKAGEQMSQNYSNLLGQGAGFASQFAGLGLQAMGQGAGLASTIDQRAHDTAMQNVGIQNEQNRYQNAQGYELAAGNAARQDSFRNAKMKLFGQIAGAGIGAAYGGG
jgi:hypothetical protein